MSPQKQELDYLQYKMSRVLLKSNGQFTIRLRGEFIVDQKFYIDVIDINNKIKN